MIKYYHYHCYCVVVRCCRLGDDRKSNEIQPQIYRINILYICEYNQVRNENRNSKIDNNLFELKSFDNGQGGGNVGPINVIIY